MEIPSTFLGWRQQSLIERVNLVHHFFHAEILAHIFPPGPTKLFAQGWIARQLRQALSESSQIAAFHQKTSPAIKTNFRGTIRVIGHNRFAGGQRLRKSARQSFARGKVRDHIATIEHLRNSCRWHKTRELESALQLRSIRAVFKTLPQRSITN